MKNLISVFTAFFLMVNATYATVRTVSNNILGGAQFTTLQAAYDASSSGDTLLVSGSNTIYHMNFWSKSLVVIGEGFNTQKENFITTKFGKASSGAGSGGSWVCAAASSGTKFYGIHFIADPTLYANGLFSGTNVSYENCLIDRLVIAYNDVHFTNCVFLYSVYLHGALTGVRINNCIFNSIAGGNTTVPQNTEINHCLFLSSSTLFVSLYGPTIKNSIFINSTDFSGISGATFNNNMVRSSGNFPPAGNVDGGGNINNDDAATVTIYTPGSLYSTSHDYHLVAGSPCIGAADDQTDIGLHGGNRNFSEYGEVLVAPVVRTVDIINPIIAPGGTLNVHVLASKPHED